MGWKPSLSSWGQSSARKTLSSGWPVKNTKLSSLRQRCSPKPNTSIQYFVNRTPPKRYGKFVMYWCIDVLLLFSLVWVRGVQTMVRGPTVARDQFSIGPQPIKYTLTLTLVYYSAVTLGGATVSNKAASPQNKINQRRCLKTNKHLNKVITLPMRYTSSPEWPSFLYVWTWLVYMTAVATVDELK